MSNELLEIFCKEYQKQMQKVRETEPFQKAELMKRSILSYGGKVPEIGDVVLVSQSAGAGNPKDQETGDKPGYGERRMQVEDLSEKCMMEKGGYATKVQITAYLEANGIKLSPETVGWYLSSNKERFIPNRAKGWSTKKSAALAA